jgi:hypothetical protein
VTEQGFAKIAALSASSFMLAEAAWFRAEPWGSSITVVDYRPLTGALLRKGAPKCTRFERYKIRGYFMEGA